MAVAAARWLGLCAVVLIAAACGGSSEGTSSSSSPSPSPSPSESHVASVDACMLVTASDASTAVGSAVVNLATVGGVAIPGTCFYGQPNGGSAGVFIYAQVYPNASATSAVDANTLAAALGGRISGVTNAKVLTGVGDKAAEYTANGAGGSGLAILVYKANVVMMIVVDPAPSPSKAEDLARTAVSRLVFS